MSIVKTSRAALAAVTIAALSTASIGTSASAGEHRRHNNDAGAAVALGIGALIVGGIIASQSRRDRHHEYRHAPPPRHYAPAYREHGPRRHHEPVKERFND
jgi:hypothetical protein